MANATRKAGADAFLGALGLAARAGRLRVGLEACSDALRRGRVETIVLAGDAPDWVIQKLEGRMKGLAEGRAVSRLKLLDGDRLGRAVGRQRVVVLAVTDGELGRRVLELGRELEASG